MSSCIGAVYVVSQGDYVGFCTGASSYFPKIGDCQGCGCSAACLDLDHG